MAFELPINDFNVSKFLSLDDGVLGKFITKALLDTKHNPLKDVVAQYAANFIKNSCTNSTRTKISISIHESLTFEESKALNEAFPELEIKYNTDVVNNHGYAAASRKCENYLLLASCGYDFDREYDKIVIIDIGGNWALNVMRNFSGIHSCSPILDDYDNLRFSSRLNQLSRFALSGRNISNFQSTCLNYMSSINSCNVSLSNPLFCNNKAQNCTIKADYAISLHSCYDISLTELADSMAKRDIRELYGSFIWHPSILLKRAGIIPVLNAHFKLNYRKVASVPSIKPKNNNVPYEIVFSFKNDSSLNYTHRFANYIAYLTVSTFYSSDKSCKFILELRENRNGIQFYKVTRLVVSSPFTYVPSLRHKIWFPDAEKFVAITYFELDNEKISAFRSGICKYDNNSYGLLRRCTMLVDKILINETLSYAYRVAEDKFKPIELVSYLQTHDRRIFFSSKDILSRNVVHDADQLFVLANVLYVYAYVRKYDQGKVNQCLLSDIRFDRKMLSSNIFSKLYSFLSLYTFFPSNDHRNVFDIPRTPFLSWLHSLLYASVRTGLDAARLIQDQIQFLEFSELVDVTDSSRDSFLEGLDKVFDSVNGSYYSPTLFQRFLGSYSNSSTTSLHLPSFSSTKSALFSFDLDRLVFESMLNLMPTLTENDKNQIVKLLEDADKDKPTCQEHNSWLEENIELSFDSDCVCLACADMCDNDCAASLVCMSDDACCVQIDEFACEDLALFYADFKVKAFLKNADDFAQTGVLYGNMCDFEYVDCSECSSFNLVDNSKYYVDTFCLRCQSRLSYPAIHSPTCWLSSYDSKFISAYESHNLTLLVSKAYKTLYKTANDYMRILLQTCCDFSYVNLDFIFSTTLSPDSMEMYPLACSIEDLLLNVFGLTFDHLECFYKYIFSYFNDSTLLDSYNFRTFRNFLNCKTEFNPWLIVLIALMCEINLEFVTKDCCFSVFTNFYASTYRISLIDNIFRISSNLATKVIPAYQLKFKFASFCDKSNEFKNVCVLGNEIAIENVKNVSCENCDYPVMYFNESCVCSAPMRVVRVLGDGKCLLRSLVQEGDIDFAADQLKTYYNSISPTLKFGIVSDEDILMKSTSVCCVDMSTINKVLNFEIWGGDELIWLYSACFQTNICIHIVNTPNYVYFYNCKYNRTIHLLYNGFHYDYLVLDVSAIKGMFNNDKAYHKLDSNDACLSRANSLPQLTLTHNYIDNHLNICNSEPSLLHLDLYESIQNLNNNPVLDSNLAKSSSSILILKSELISPAPKFNYPIVTVFETNLNSVQIINSQNDSMSPTKSSLVSTINSDSKTFVASDKINANSIKSLSVSNTDINDLLKSNYCLKSSASSPNLLSTFESNISLSPLVPKFAPIIDNIRPSWSFAPKFEYPLTRKASIGIQPHPSLLDPTFNSSPNVCPPESIIAISNETICTFKTAFSSSIDSFASIPYCEADRRSVSPRFEFETKTLAVVCDSSEPLPSSSTVCQNLDSPTFSSTTKSNINNNDSNNNKSLDSGLKHIFKASLLNVSQSASLKSTAISTANIANDNTKSKTVAFNNLAKSSISNNSLAKPSATVSDTTNAVSKTSPSTPVNSVVVNTPNTAKNNIKSKIVAFDNSAKSSISNTLTPKSSNSVSNASSIAKVSLTDDFNAAYANRDITGFKFNYHVGDLFKCNSSLAHCVSKDLHMGAGIAVEFKKRFGRIEILRNQNPVVVSVLHLFLENRYIFYLVTKENYFDKPTLKNFYMAIVKLREIMLKFGVKEIAIPLLGAGRDKLNWFDVFCMLAYVFRNTDIKFTICVLRDELQKVLDIESGLNAGGINVYLRNSYPYLYRRFGELADSFKVYRTRGVGSNNFKKSFDMKIAFNCLTINSRLTGAVNCKVDYLDCVPNCKALFELYRNSIDNFSGLVFGIDLKNIDLEEFLQFLQNFNVLKIYILDSTLASAFVYFYINIDMKLPLDVSCYKNRSLHKIVNALEHKLTCTFCCKTINSAVKVSREIYEDVWVNCGELLDDIKVSFIASTAYLSNTKIFTVKLVNSNSFVIINKADDTCILTVDDTVGSKDDDFFPRVWHMLTSLKVPLGYDVVFDCTDVIFDRRYVRGFLGKCKNLYVLGNVIKNTFDRAFKDNNNLTSKFLQCEQLSPPDYKPVYNEFDYRINALREAKYMYKCQARIIQRDIADLHKQALCVVNNTQLASKSLVPDYGMYDINKCKWVIKPSVNDDIYKYAWVFDGSKLVSMDVEYGDAFADLIADNIRYISVNKQTFSNTAPYIFEALNSVAESSLSNVGELTLVEGAPGCGKSTYILRNHKFMKGSDLGDIVLTTTREAAADMRKRAALMYGVDANDRYIAKMLKRKYNTGDSYLINFTDRCETLWVDEGLMKHAGEVLAYAVKSEASRVVVLGDAAQIPFINRFREINVSYYNIKSMGLKTTYLNVTRRCPLDVAVCLNRLGVYSFSVKSSNDVMRSMTVKNTLDFKPTDVDENTVILVFTQGEKEQLKQSKFPRVYTVHEFQGNQSANVILVRLNHKKNELYESSNHNVVAISRHTKSLVYYTSVLGDYTSRLISKQYNDAELKAVFENSTLRGGFSMCPDFEVEIKPSKTFVMYKQNKLARDVVEKNFFTGYKAFMPILREVPVIKFHDVQCLGESTEHDDYTALQEFYDKVFPGNSSYDRTYEQEIIEMNDFAINCDAFCIDLNGFILPSRKPTLIPNLRTAIQPPIMTSLRMVMYAFGERNGGVPDLTAETSRDNIAFALLNSFINTYIDNFNLFSAYSEDPLCANTDDIMEWFYSQPPKVQNEVESDMGCIFDRDLSKFMYILKKNAKPVLDASGVNKFQAPQTIAFHDKLVNSVFCPLVRAMKLRLYAVLKKNFIIMSDMSVQEFEDVLNYRLPPKAAKYFNYSLELDISKYDKSQQELLFRVEETLMLMLGFPKDLLPYWRYAHAYSTLHNLATKFTGKTVYQRKSGDAMTFFGNTIILMATMAYVYDLKDAFAMFSGDDSYVFSKTPIGSVDDAYDFAFMFNLETKLLHYEYPYFCSKFLIPINSYEWKVVPDPIKVITKLGRSDLVDWQHLEEYRISTVDLVSVLRDYNVRAVLNEALRDRYELDFDTQFYVLVLCNIVTSVESFKRLFREPEGGLATYTVRPSLDI